MLISDLEEEMRISDLELEGKGIFYYMNELETLPFSEVISIEVLDDMFIGLHGQKVLSPTVASVMLRGGVTEDNMKRVASMLLVMYGMAWGRLYELLTQEIPLETYSLITTEQVSDSEETRHEVNSESTRQDLDKVTGYESSSMIDDSAKNIESLDNVLNEGTRTGSKNITREVKGLQNSRVLETTRLVRFIESNLIYNVVFENVANFIGSLIY